MQVAIYNENCVAAGQQVSQSTLDEYGGDWHDDGDWTVYDGTPEELLVMSETLPHCRQRAYDQYYWRVAGAIREAVFAERPELRPAEAEEVEDD